MGILHFLYSAVRLGGGVLGESISQPGQIFEAMPQEQLVTIAVLGLLFGPILAIWPYKLARWSEIIDAIGRKPAGGVEPADWKVLLNRIFGAVLAIAGGVSAVLLLL